MIYYRSNYVLKYGWNFFLYSRIQNYVFKYGYDIPLLMPPDSTPNHIVSQVQHTIAQVALN